MRFCYVNRFVATKQVVNALLLCASQSAQNKCRTLGSFCFVRPLKGRTQNKSDRTRRAPRQNPAQNESARPFAHVGPRRGRNHPVVQPYHPASSANTGERGRSLPRCQSGRARWFLPGLRRPEMAAGTAPVWH